MPNQFVSYPASGGCGSFAFPIDSPVFTGQILASTGNASLPSYSFTGETGCGMYVTNGEVGISFSGNEILGIGTSVITAYQVVASRDGSASSPGYQFSNRSNLGVFRNNADSLGISASGAIVADFAFGVATISGNLILSTAGNGIQIKGGSNARIGTGTLSGGTAAVSNTSITSNTLVFLTDAGGGVLANIGSLYVSGSSAGVAFSVSSTNALDSSNFNWMLIEKN